MTKFQVLFDDETVALLTQWRRDQPDLPTVSEAIRRIVSERLKEEPVQ